MKKLLMIVTVACIATMSQALTVNWTLSWSAAIESDFTFATSPVIAQSFLFYTSSTELASMESALAAGLAYSNSTNPADGWTKVDNAELFADVYVTDSSSKELSGKIEVTTKPTEAGYYYGFLLAEDGETAFLVNFASDTTVAGNPASIVATEAQWNSAGEGAVGGSYMAKEAQQITVPEPTAFALIALGVAGLALRRRTK